MSTAILTNRIKFPSGYRKVSQVSPYTPWNGFVSGQNSPGVSQFGATYTFTVASVPADLSTIQMVGPDGKGYTFQFVYNASVQTLGIKIPLPASGASTAAQVATAFLGVVNQASALDVLGNRIVFPWSAQQTGAAVIALNWNVAGVGNSSGVLPGTISLVVTQGGFGQAATVPGGAGFVGAFLPGS